MQSKVTDHGDASIFHAAWRTSGDTQDCVAETMQCHPGLLRRPKNSNQAIARKAALSSGALAKWKTVMLSSTKKSSSGLASRYGLTRGERRLP